MACPESPHRVYPPQASSEIDLIFSDGKVPPTFAAIQLAEGDSGRLSVCGPFNEEALAIYLTEWKEETPERILRRMDELEAAQPYGILGLDELHVSNNYPGGKEALAKNLARVILGSQ